MAEPTLFCTYFDSNFVVRGLAMIRSLAHHRRSPWRLVVLCLDEAGEKILARLKQHEPALASVELLALARLEAEDPTLLAARANRSWLEYIFTCTPALCRWLLASRPEVITLVYLDADLYFFADDGPLFAKMGDAPVGIIEHRFPRGLEHLVGLYGRFNVGWVAFNRSPEALACIERWRDQCLEWCDEGFARGQYGDQKYLDEWPQIAPALAVIDNPGANLAPWNLARHRLQAVPDGVPQVDGGPLIFYHFHGLGQWGGPGDYTASCNVPRGASAVAVRGIYEPYLAELIEVELAIRAAASDLLPARIGRLIRKPDPRVARSIPGRIAEEVRGRLRSRRIRFHAGRPDLLWRALVWAKVVE